LDHQLCGKLDKFRPDRNHLDLRDRKPKWAAILVPSISLARTRVCWGLF
jgi:hypothetical protein